MPGLPAQHTASADAVALGEFLDAGALLGVIEGRCLAACNGAAWQASVFHRLYDVHDRPAALREMMGWYVEHMHSNEPVHTWPLV